MLIVWVTSEAVTTSSECQSVNAATKNKNIYKKKKSTLIQNQN